MVFLTVVLVSSAWTSYARVLLGWNGLLKGKKTMKMNSCKLMALIWMSCVLISSALVVVSVDPSVEEHSIPTDALGAGMLYSWDSDALYANGDVAHMIMDLDISPLRWPGGAVSAYFHWDDLNGNGWLDNWDSSYDRADDKPPEDFMDLDEYLALIDQTGSEIMLGVNLSSGQEWGREAEGLAEATSMLQHCYTNGYDVKYIFLDNEIYHPDNAYNKDPDNDGESWNTTNYANAFNTYAAQIKTVYPNAKLIANWKNVVNTDSFAVDVSNMLSIAGANIDYMDIHFYWEWNDASWTLWKSQTPMVRTATTMSYKDSVLYANGVFDTLGYPDVEIFVMEWNWGGGATAPWKTDPLHTGFKTALLQSEMQMQFLQAGLQKGVIFAMHSPNIPANEEKHIMRDGVPTSTAPLMWLFSKVPGKTIVESSSPATGIYILTAKGSQGELVTYLLNKTDTDETIEFDISGYTVSSIKEAWRFSDNGFGKGEVTPIGVWETGGKKRTSLLADSLNMIVFNDPDTDADTLGDAWEIEHFGDLVTADETTDSDSDGASDYNEQIAATDPNNAQSALTFDGTFVEPPTPFADTLLLGWDTTTAASDTNATGVSGTLASGGLQEVDATAGSTDGTFGSAKTGAETALTGYVVRTVTPGSTDTAEFTILNDTGLNLQLSTIHFDYSRWFVNSPQDVTLIYVGGDLSVTTGTVISTTTGIATAGKAGNYTDFDWSLSGLSDSLLLDGESATFALVASNAISTTTSGAFDNIAISGSGLSTGVGTTLDVHWRTTTGLEYQFVRSTNLVSGTWDVIASPQRGVVGSRTTTTTLGATDAAFYRVEVTP